MRIITEFAFESHKGQRRYPVIHDDHPYNIEVLQVVNCKIDCNIQNGLSVISFKKTPKPNTSFRVLLKESLTQGESKNFLDNVKQLPVITCSDYLRATGLQLNDSAAKIDRFAQRINEASRFIQQMVFHNFANGNKLSDEHKKYIANRVNDIREQATNILKAIGII